MERVPLDEIIADHETRILCLENINTPSLASLEVDLPKETIEAKPVVTNNHTPNLYKELVELRNRIESLEIAVYEQSKKKKEQQFYA